VEVRFLIVCQGALLQNVCQQRADILALVDSILEMSLVVLVRSERNVRCRSDGQRYLKQSRWPSRFTVPCHNWACSCRCAFRCAESNIIEQKGLYVRRETEKRRGWVAGSSVEGTHPHSQHSEIPATPTVGSPEIWCHQHCRPVGGVEANKDSETMTVGKLASSAENEPHFGPANNTKRLRLTLGYLPSFSTSTMRILI
jgi:hypothetical protein